MQGVSTRKVSKIIEKLCGHSVSSTQVSTCAAKLDTQLQLWRERPLGECPYLIFDARYEKVRHGGLLVDCAVLIATGIGTDGKRTVLGVSVTLSEAEAHWQAFFTSLVARGLCGTRFIVSAAHPGIAAARQAVFPSVPWQRCQFHLQQNAQAYVPRLEMRAGVAESICFAPSHGAHPSDSLRLAVSHPLGCSICASPDLPVAQARLKERVGFYAKSSPNSPPGWRPTSHKALPFYGLPSAHHRRMRTSNAIERVNQELKRCTRVAALFPNEASLLRLVSACSASRATSGSLAKFTST